HHLSRKKFVHRPIKKFFFYHVGSILNIVVVYGICSTIYYDNIEDVKSKYLKRQIFFTSNGGYGFILRHKCP
ncbi:MAG: hypothetical protein ACNYWU_11465, partial [Desulfobacterales bacterium]